MTIIKLPNGRTAVSFVPEDSTELAIVHMSTIKKLAALLPKANPREILAAHIDTLQDFRDPRTMIQDIITESKDFITFHETVNLISTYEPVKESAPVMV